MLVALTRGLPFVGALALAAVLGGLSGPALQWGLAQVLEAPRERLLVGWAGLCLLAFALAEVRAGRGGQYATVVAQLVVFAGIGDSMALLREVAVPANDCCDRTAYE